MHCKIRHGSLRTSNTATCNKDSSVGGFGLPVVLNRGLVFSGSVSVHAGPPGGQGVKGEFGIAEVLKGRPGTMVDKSRKVPFVSSTWGS